MQPMPPQPAPPPSGGSNTAISPGEIVLWASAGVALIFSFFPWISADGADSANAWSGGDFGDIFNVFPLATYVPLFVIASAAISLLKRFGNVSLGLEQYIGLSGKALQRAFAWFAFFIAFGWLLFVGGDGPFSADRGVGLWLSILATIGAVVGNILIDRLPAKPKAASAPGQWGAPQPQPGYPPQPGQPPAPQPQAPQPQAPQPQAPQPPPPQPAPPPQPQPAPPPQPQQPPPPQPQQPPPPSPQPPPPAPPGQGTPPPPPPPG